jgi:dipeptidase E
MEPENLLLDRFVLSEARAPRPRICFVPTAGGDSALYVAGFYRAFSGLDCVPSDLQLFERQISDLESFVLRQDVIYVGGGSTANLLAVWRVHGLDGILRRAWEEGVLLCGVSAGMNCWFESSVTDSFGPSRLSPLHDGLGLVAGSACPHYDSAEQRRPVYRELVASGELPDGWAADDGAALVFEGSTVREVVSSRPDAQAYRVECSGEGLSESQLAARYLG